MNTEKKIVILLGIKALLSTLLIIIYFNAQFWEIIFDNFLHFDIHFILTFGFSYVFMNIFILIMNLLVFIGCFQLIKEKEIRMLKIFKLPLFLFVATMLAWIISNLLTLNTETSFFTSKIISWQSKTLKLLDFVLLGFVFIHFYKKRTFSLSKKNKIETPKLSRFINSLIDGIFILNISIYFSGVLTQGSILDNYLPKEYIFILYALFLRISYYFVLEVIFLQTIGKLHNNNFVVFKGNKVTAIFKRTLSRYIPFDAFSFLGDDGWHDSVSETKVMQET